MPTSIDTLKPFDEITQPDSRNSNFRFDLTDLHANLSVLLVHEGVPEDARQLFETAKNVCLYSWFVYRFHQVAEQVAYSSLELALRTRVTREGLEKPPKGSRWTLAALLRHAADSGWIRNDAFPSLRARAWRIADAKNIRRLIIENHGNQESWPVPDPTEDEIQEVLEQIDMPAMLQQSLPYMRNLLAHGSNILHPNSVATLQTVCEVLNQLFELPVTDSRYECPAPRFRRRKTASNFPKSPSSKRTTMKKGVNKDFISKLQAFTANSMISASAVRNQGAPGVAAKAREYCGTLRLAELRRLRRSGFQMWLDARTEELRQKLPEGAQNWGTARKSINIFLRAAAYTTPLADHFELERLLPYLEVPLDSKVAAGLRRQSVGRKLPSWETIRDLDASISGEYQAVAEHDARLKRVHRADLDAYYWVPDAIE